MGQIRVLIVDDSAFMRHALGRLLVEAPDIEVVGRRLQRRRGAESSPASCVPTSSRSTSRCRSWTGWACSSASCSRRRRGSSCCPAGRRRVPKRPSTRSSTARSTSCPSRPARCRSTSAASDDDLVAKIRAAAGMSEAAFLRHRQVAAMNLTLINNRARLNAAAQSAEVYLQAPGGSRLRSLPALHGAGAERDPDRPGPGSPPAGWS